MFQYQWGKEQTDLFLPTETQLTFFINKHFRELKLWFTPPWRAALCGHKQAEADLGGGGVDQQREGLQWCSFIPLSFLVHPNFKPTA